MRDTLAMLVELQGLEDSLRDLRVNRQRLASLKSDNEETKEVFLGMLGQQRGQIEETQAFCKEKEADIKTAEENARRARSRLSGVSSQRELTALNKELEIARRTNQQRTEEVVKLLDQLEAAKTAFAKKEEEWKALEDQMQTLEANLAAEIEAGEGQATENRKRQAEIRGRIDKPTLARFDRISRALNGYALAFVDGDACQGCQVSVPAQQLVRLMRMETLESCQNCKRLIVHRDSILKIPVVDAANPS